MHRIRQGRENLFHLCLLRRERNEKSTMTMTSRKSHQSAAPACKSTGLLRKGMKYRSLLKDLKLSRTATAFHLTYSQTSRAVDITNQRVYNPQPSPSYSK